jgi:hypothetical protein
MLPWILGIIAAIIVVFEKGLAQLKTIAEAK